MFSVSVSFARFHQADLGAVSLALASLSVVGGETPRFHVGGFVNTVIGSREDKSMRERGIVVALDRTSGRYGKE